LHVNITVISSFNPPFAPLDEVADVSTASTSPANVTTLLSCMGTAIVSVVVLLEPAMHNVKAGTGDINTFAYFQIALH
jgi:hypothetical protein